MLELREPEDWTADRAGWIRVSADPPAFHCDRCGDAVPFTTPVLLEPWTSDAQTFVAVHRRCRPVKPEPQASLLGDLMPPPDPAP